MRQLIIASPNYSSWSLRAWMALEEAHIPFTTTIVSLATADFKKTLSARSPSGRVPVLLDEGLEIWDTLSIIERMHEQFPHHPVWPKNPAHRARARSLCAEMHSGFSALRGTLPMNIRARFPTMPLNRAVRQDINRLFQMWSGCFNDPHRGAGPFLFGDWSAADAYFAPVLFRLRTYGIECPPAINDYANAVLSTSSAQKWLSLCAQEPWASEWVDEDEPYQDTPPQ